MEGPNTDYGKKPYETVKSPLENATYQTTSYDYIVVPAVYKDGKYVIPKHVGERGASKGESVAGWLIVYDTKTGTVERVPISESITKADWPGAELYNYVKDKYGSVILITSRKLKVSEDEGELEKIVNETEEEGTDAYRAIGERTGKDVGDEYSDSEEKYAEKESSEDGNAEGKGLSDEGGDFEGSSE